MNRVLEFNDAHEAFVVQGLACGMSYHDIVDKMLLFFSEFDPLQKKRLMIKVARVAQSEKARDFIRDSRETWEKECQDVPIAIRKIRLQRLENEYHRLERESIEKVIVTPSNQEIVVYRQNTQLLLKLLMAAKSEMAELTQPTRDAPQGKSDSQLQVNMRSDDMFKDDVTKV